MFLLARYALGLGLPAYARQKLAEFKPHVAHFTVCDLLGMDSVGWARQNNVALVSQEREGGDGGGGTVVLL